MTLPALGLDVAKLKFNACLIREGGKLRHRIFPNNPEGFAQLSDWLKQQQIKQVHACLEATGAYGDALAAYLHEQAHMVSVVNPAAILENTTTSLPLRGPNLLANSSHAATGPIARAKAEHRAPAATWRLPGTRIAPRRRRGTVRSTVRRRLPEPVARGAAARPVPTAWRHARRGSVSARHPGSRCG